MINYFWLILGTCVFVIIMAILYFNERAKADLEERAAMDAANVAHTLGLDSEFERMVDDEQKGDHGNKS